MKRDDNSIYLLYIEPKKEEKIKEPINDDLTKLLELAISKAKRGTANYSDKKDMGNGVEFNGRKIPSFRPGYGYKGTHRTDCGERSDNCDFLLENGMITNSLAPFYVKWYRYSIPESDIKKLKDLADFYHKKIW